jgi:pantetheine-phosphate adenylyltransferase
MKEESNGDWTCPVCKATFREVIQDAIGLNPFKSDKPIIKDQVAVFPGSFDPWHEGHQDVLDKALKIFQKVVILQIQNPKKPPATPLQNNLDKYPGLKWRFLAEVEKERILVCQRQGFLSDSITAISEADNLNIVAVVRGLRNGYDLQTEMVQQYWYEDLKMTLPIIYIITDRKFAHISSTAIREVESLKEAFKK